jgi:hypothetical protein
MRQTDRGLEYKLTCSNCGQSPLQTVETQDEPEIGTTEDSETHLDVDMLQNEVESQ